MIKKLTFQNFYSFLNETIVSFEINNKPPSSNYDIELDDKSRLNKVVGVIGPNGSGKTQFLRPLAFLSWFITDSFSESDTDEKIPFKPHMLKTKENTSFNLEFYYKKDTYRYNLVVNTKRVIQESLHIKTSHLYSYIFQREFNGSGYDFKQKNFDLSSKVGKKIKANSSVISAANILGSEIAKNIVSNFRRSVYNINVSGRENYNYESLLKSAKFFHSNKNYKEKVNKLVCDMDLGLSDIEIVKVESFLDKKKNSESFLPIGIHKFKKRSFELPFFEESSGTQSVYVMLRYIIPVLENGGIAILDELDNDSHFHMLLKLIELFRDEHTNPNKAQLIFSCHTHEVLNVLRKHQIYLIEKSDLISDAWRLDEMIGLRADDNLYSKYQSGALGAIPNL